MASSAARRCTYETSSHSYESDGKLLFVGADDWTERSIVPLILYSGTSPTAANVAVLEPIFGVKVLLFSGDGGIGGCLV